MSETFDRKAIIMNALNLLNADTRIKEMIEEKVNASLGHVIYALSKLTAIEFRMWIEACKTYENFDPTHFEGLEEQFIKTGKWEFEEEIPEFIKRRSEEE
jgi:hypothetical protein